jgi:hypothetical protein
VSSRCREGRRRRACALVTLVLLSWTPLGCAAGAGAAAAQPPAPRAASFPDDGNDKPLPRYRSHRLALSLPLPDGAAWRIDDHSRPELIATHGPTRSRLVLAVFPADELVGRGRCEELARAQNLVPVAAPRERRILEDEVAITQETFDTRVEVTLEPGTGADRSLVGSVMAFGGFLRKCYAFVYSTQVDDATDEAVLSSRLALVRTRVLGGLELEAILPAPRDASGGPKLAPAP